MRFVERLDRFSQDLMIPGNTHDDVGFVHAGTIDLQANPQAARAVSIKFIREAARRIPEIGLVSVTALLDEEANSAELRAELDQARAALAEAEAQLARINGIVRSDKGLKIVRAQGAAAHKSNVKVVQ